MGNQYLHVGSITNAMRGKRILERQGIRAYIHRTVHPPDGDGCGYSLLVTGTGTQAVGILQTGGIKVIRVSDAI